MFSSKNGQIILNIPVLRKHLSFVSPYVLAYSGPEVIKLLSCSTKLSMKFFLLINVKMQTFISGKNSILCLSEPKNAEFLDIFILKNI